MAETKQRAAIVAEPLRDIYLSEDGRLMMPMHRAGSPELLRLLSLVGLFVLAIAVVNFVNLATARSAERAREIGVRKAVGADRAGLVAQFLVEAVVLAVLSGVAALGLVALALPGYDALTDAGLTLADLLAPRTLGIGAALVVAVGLLAGAYPALALSGFRPAETLRGQVQSGPRASRLRNGLVVFQFAVSTVLLVATLVVGSQLGHLRAAPVGFDRDGVLLVPVGDVSQQAAADLKAAFAGVAGVRAVALTGAPPTEAGWESQQVSARGASGATQNMETVIADADYARALGLRLAGRPRPAAGRRVGRRDGRAAQRRRRPRARVDARRGGRQTDRDVGALARRGRRRARGLRAPRRGAGARPAGVLRPARKREVGGRARRTRRRGVGEKRGASRGVGVARGRRPVRGRGARRCRGGAVPRRGAPRAGVRPVRRPRASSWPRSACSGSPRTPCSGAARRSACARCSARPWARS